MKPLDDFAQSLGFKDATAVHYWICDVGKSVAALREQFNPKDHYEFLQDINDQILEELQIPDFLRGEEGISCYVFFEQYAYIRYKDFGLKDKEGNVRRSLENNMEAIYAEGSPLHTMAKMVMILTGIS